MLAQVSELLRVMRVKDTRKFRPKSFDQYINSVSSLQVALTGTIQEPEPDVDQQEGHPELEPDEEPSRLTRLERLAQELLSQVEEEKDRRAPPAEVQARTRYERIGESL
jgi:hypothetical protein